MNTKFLNHFWITLLKKFETFLKYSSMCHRQIGDQTEMTNWNLGNMLRCVFGDKLKQWDVHLLQIEFAFNNMLNWSIGKSPFKIVYTRPLWFALDLVSLPKILGLSIWLSQGVQAEVRDKLEQTNTKYKQAADKYRRTKVFQERDLVMVYLQNNHFPVGTYSKLQNRKYSHCCILKKINDNTYVVILPKEMSFSPTINVVDLLEYHPPDQQQSDADPTSEMSFLLIGSELMQDVSTLSMVIACHDLGVDPKPLTRGPRAWRQWRKGNSFQPCSAGQRR